MNQNRNKLIDLMISNLSTAVVHKILGIAIHEEKIRGRYEKEQHISLDIAKRYRQKINPVDRVMPYNEGISIKASIMKKVSQELTQRIEKGYQNVQLELIEGSTDKFLKELKIIT